MTVRALPTSLDTHIQVDLSTHAHFAGASCIMT